MRPSIVLGRIAGIAIGIHYTWLFVALLMTWSLAQGYFPDLYPGWSSATYWLAGSLAVLALFGSVLFHELAHSLVAIRRRIPVRGITLFVFGGVSAMQEEAEHPRDEFLVAVVGPLASFFLAAICWAGLTLVPTADSAPAAILAYLATINALLGGFNLVPGFPLDGGRVLRSIIWGATGSLRRAPVMASYLGRGLGILLVIWGFSQVLTGAFLNEMWIAFIGWFLNGAAESERQGQAVKATLRGVSVARLMDRQPPVAGPAVSLQQFVDDHVLGRGQRAVLVVDDGELAGLMSITDAKRVARDAWPTTPIARVMTPTPLATVSPHDGLDEALRRLVEGSYNQLPVVDGSRLIGLLNRADVLRYLQYRETLGLEPGAADAQAEPQPTARRVTTGV